MKKKLLQINVTCNWGSTGSIAEGIAQVARNTGWETYIAHGSRYVRDSECTTFQISSKKEEYLDVIGSLLFDASGRFVRNGTNKLIEYIKKINPTIIHLHNIHGHYLNYPLLFNFLKDFGCPVIWTLHDCWAFTGHCVHFLQNNCTKWQTECYDCDLISDFPKSFFCDTSRSTYALKKQLFTSLGDKLYLVPVSYWEGELLTKSFLKSIPKRVIHNGINLEIFKRRPTQNVIQKYGLSNKKIVLAVSSGWSLRKGLGDFCKLRSCLSDAEYEFVIVGVDEKQIKDLPNGITGIRRTMNAIELSELYSCASVLVTPTYHDNYPTVIIEALACGTPVVTYATAGASEEINDYTGRVVTKGDIKAMASCVSEVCKSDMQNRFLFRINYAKENLSMQTSYQKYIELYEDLIK